MRHRRSGRGVHTHGGRAPALASSLAVGLASAAALVGPGVADGACITRLPVKYTLKSSFAPAYRRVLSITVNSRAPLIRNLRVKLYTFAGDLLGRGYRRALSGGGVIRVKLRFGLQPGVYTLYAEGEPNPNPSCGPKHASSVIRFFGCFASLPVSFTQPLDRVARDYGRSLQFTLASRGPLIRGVNVRVSGFAGETLGTTSVAELFGSVTVNVPLARALSPGDYTIGVEGSIPSQPRSCGAERAERVVAFS